MILQLGKTRWYLGMIWNGFDTAPTSTQIKEEAAHYGAKHYALRISDLATQAGFSQGTDLNEGGFFSQFTHSGKTFSLAARLASAVAEPWFGVFDLGNGQYWYIAVRDGYSILPDGDLVGSREQIDEVRDVHAGFNDWRQVEGDVASLEELLAKITAQEDEGTASKTALVRIRSLGSSAATHLGFRIPLSWKVISLVLASLGLMGAAWYWQTMQAAEQERQKVAQERAVQAQKLANQVLAPLAFPPPNLWLSACKEVLFALPLSSQAWQLASLSCVNDQALVQWRLAPGATVKERPQGILNSDGSQISQSIALAGLKSPPASLDSVSPDSTDSTGNAIAQPGTLETNLLALRFIAQSTGMSLDLASAPEKSQGVLPGQASSQLNQVANAVIASGSQVVSGGTMQKELKSQTFVLTSKAAPFGIDFSHIPGMRITKLSTNVTDDAGYKLEGSVYGY